MKGTKVASRYAKALLELAEEKKQLDSVLGDMNFLLQISDSTKDFELLLHSPLIKADKKIKIFGLLFDQFEEVTMAFIKLLTKNGREAYLPTIAQEFDSQVKAAKGIVPMTLVSAYELEDSTKATILNKIQSAVEGDLHLTEEIDESLIGGFMVKMGDTRVDASVLSQFNNLKQRLTR